MYWLIVLTLISNVPFFGQGEHLYSSDLHSSGLEIKSLIGGNDTYPGEHNYVVGINCNDRGCKCTGSIIDRRFVVSAAHCVFENGSFKYRYIEIVAGTNDVSDHQDPRRIEMGVDKTYIPREYNRTENLNYEYDIAVLRLSHSLHLKRNNLQKLSLPTKTHSKLVGKQAIFLGFGASEVEYLARKDGTVEPVVSYQNTKLYSAEVTILANNQCLDPLVSDSNFCGRMIKNNSYHYGACDGDSGGPLVYKSKVLLGVFTNAGVICNSRLDFEVYQRVTSFTGFIQNAMKDETIGMLFRTY